MIYGPKSVTVSTSFREMNKCEGIKTLVLFWLMLLSSGFISIVGDGSEPKNIKSKQEKPPATGLMRDMYSVLTTSSMSYWDRAKSIINQVQTQFFPPNLDFRSRDGVQSDGGEGTRERMKEAAEKSFVMSKEVIEESAKSAAGVVGEAVQMTTDKVKKSTSGGDKTHAEL